MASSDPDGGGAAIAVPGRSHEVVDPAPAYHRGVGDRRRLMLLLPAAVGQISAAGLEADHGDERRAMLHEHGVLAVVVSGDGVAEDLDLELAEAVLQKLARRGYLYYIMPEHPRVVAIATARRGGGLTETLPEEMAALCLPLPELNGLVLVAAAAAPEGANRASIHGAAKRLARTRAPAAQLGIIVLKLLDQLKGSQTHWGAGSRPSNGSDEMMYLLLDKAHKNLYFSSTLPQKTQLRIIVLKLPGLLRRLQTHWAVGSRPCIGSDKMMYLLLDKAHQTLCFSSTLPQKIQLQFQLCDLGRVVEHQNIERFGDYSQLPSRQSRPHVLATAGISLRGGRDEDFEAAKAVGKEYPTKLWNPDLLLFNCISPSPQGRGRMGAAKVIWLLLVMLLLVMSSQAQATDDVCPVDGINSNLTKICSAPLFQSKKPFESTTVWLDELDSFLLKSLQSAIVTKDPTDCQDNSWRKITVGIAGLFFNMVPNIGPALMILRQSGCFEQRQSWILTCSAFGLVSANAFWASYLWSQNCKDLWNFGQCIVVLIMHFLYMGFFWYQAARNRYRNLISFLMSVGAIATVAIVLAIQKAITTAGIFGIVFTSIGHVTRLIASGRTRTKDRITLTFLGMFGNCLMFIYKFCWTQETLYKIGSIVSLSSRATDLLVIFRYAWLEWVILRLYLVQCILLMQFRGMHYLGRIVEITSTPVNREHMQSAAGSVNGQRSQQKDEEAPEVPALPTVSQGTDPGPVLRSCDQLDSSVAAANES